LEAKHKVKIKYFNRVRGNKMLRICDECGQFFQPIKKTHYRCSERCRYNYERNYAKERARFRKEKSLKNGKIIKCSYCGEEFLAINEFRKNCSSECSKKYNLSKSRAHTKYKRYAGKPLYQILKKWFTPKKNPITVSNFDWPPNRENIKKAVEEYLKGGGKIEVHKSQGEFDLLNENTFIDEPPDIHEIKDYYNKKSELIK
tara:strand:+ start:55 stop:657 length:603 start_codon:yes stop_codon:yes gene_type:complete